MEFISLFAIFPSSIKARFTFYKEPLLFTSVLGQNFISGASAVVFFFFFSFTLFFLLSLSCFCSVDHEYVIGGGRVKPKQIYFVCQASSL